MTWAPTRLIFASCGVRSVTPRSDEILGHDLHVLGVLLEPFARDAGESRPASCSLQERDFLGSPARPRGHERAHDVVGVGLSWNT